jgi:hypothetical protein
MNCDGWPDSDCHWRWPRRRPFPCVVTCVTRCEGRRRRPGGALTAVGASIRRSSRPGHPGGGRRGGAVLRGPSPAKTALRRSYRRRSIILVRDVLINKSRESAALNRSKTRPRPDPQLIEVHSRHDPCHETAWPHFIRRVRASSPRAQRGRSASTMMTATAVRVVCLVSPCLPPRHRSTDAVNGFRRIATRMSAPEVLANVYGQPVEVS